MGGNRRANKGPRVRERHQNEKWFEKNDKRQKVRNKIARKARRANRSK